MKKISSILVILSCVNVTLSQVQIFVKNGTLTVGQTTHQAGAVVSLKTSDKVVTSEKTKAIVKKQSQLMELEKNKTYTYNQIQEKLDKKSNFTQAFVNAATSQQVVQKRNIGAAPRGLEIDSFSINLLDTAWIMNDFYRVKWNSDLPSKQLGSIRLYSSLSTEPILESTEKHIDIKALNPGWYHIDFDIEQKGNTESWMLENRYVFYIPTKEEKEQVLIEYQGITEELKQFEDDELSDIIIDAYLSERRLYGLE